MTEREKMEQEHAERKFFGGYTLEEYSRIEPTHQTFGAKCVCGWPGNGEVKQITARDLAEAEARAVTLHALHWADYAREVRCRNTYGISILPIS